MLAVFLFGSLHQLTGPITRTVQPQKAAGRCLSPADRSTASPVSLCRTPDPVPAARGQHYGRSRICMPAGDDSFHSSISRLETNYFFIRHQGHTPLPQHGDQRMHQPVGIKMCITLKEYSTQSIYPGMRLLCL